MVEGVKMDTYQDICSPAVGITGTKIYLNSTILDAKWGARYCTANFTEFFVDWTMKIFQYMHIHQHYIPQANIKEYSLTDKFFWCKRICLHCTQKRNVWPQGSCHPCISTIFHSLCQIWLYTYAAHSKSLVSWKLPNNFHPCHWQFCIKLFNHADSNHLLGALKDKYDITIDCSGTSFLGITIDWNYQDRYDDISLPKYVPKALKNFNHLSPNCLQHMPHPWSVPVCGQKVQYITQDKSKALDSKCT